MSKFFRVRRRDLMLLVVVVAGLLVLQALSGGCRRAQPPVDTTTTAPAEPEPQPTTSVPIEPAPTTTIPAPPPGATTPRDYIRISQIDGILNGTNSQNPGLIAEAQFMAWAGWRDPLNVVEYCPDALWYLGATEPEMAAFGDTGAGLVRRAEDTWLPRWAQEGPNRRCGKEPNPPEGPGWCEVTNVRKNSEWSGFREEFKAHLAQASLYRARAGRCRGYLVAHGGSEYDSIAGWCDSMHRAGASVLDCPQ